MSSDLLGAATGGCAAQLGRYFSVVSALPSAVFVGYLSLLVASGAWSGAVRIDRAVRELDLRTGILLTTTSLIVAIALHPLQYTLIQLLEGYWGRSTPARALAYLRVRHHRRVSSELAAEARNSSVDEGEANSPTISDEVLRLTIRAREAQRLQVSYPDDLQHVLPTRLGNVLRRYEVNAGSPYGVKAVHGVPRLGMVSGDREARYVENQRTQLELAVRVAVLGLVAAALTLVLLWRHGAWLLLALLPYAVAYLAYRGAIVAAHEYGTALTVLIELNRFALYERLHLELPDSLAAERWLNHQLMPVLESQEGMQLRYRHPTVVQPPAAPASGEGAQP